MNACAEFDEPMFDTRLLTPEGSIEAPCGLIRTMPIKTPPAEWIGQRGVLMPAGHNLYRFNPYCDQTLERLPELDEPGRLGWRCDTLPEGFTCPAWIVPGDDGAFIEDETEAFQIRVPLEFMELCDRLGMDVEDVLHGFIADSAGLMSWVRCPRADELSSNGSDERMLAQEYIERAYCFRTMTGE